MKYVFIILGIIIALFIIVNVIARLDSSDLWVIIIILGLAVYFLNLSRKGKL